MADREKQTAIEKKQSVEELLNTNLMAELSAWQSVHDRNGQRTVFRASERGI